MESINKDRQTILDKDKKTQILKTNYYEPRA